MRRNIFGLVVLIILLLLPMLMSNNYVLHLLIMTSIYSVLALGFSMMWKNRLIMAGQAGFWAIGAYTSALRCRSRGRL